MTTITKIILSLAAGVLGVSAISAKTMEQTYVESYLGRTDIPVPVEVHMPLENIPIPGTVLLQFSLTEAGVPTDLTVKSATDHSLIEPAKAAVSQWRFTLPTINNKTATKLELPIRFVLKD